MQKLKEKNVSNGNHGREVGWSFFIASGNATKLLETIDESFNEIALSGVLFVERTFTMFIAASSNGATDMVAMEIVAKVTAGVAFICHQALWA